MKALTSANAALLISLASICLSFAATTLVVFEDHSSQPNELLRLSARISAGTEIGISQTELGQLLKDIDVEYSVEKLGGSLDPEIDAAVGQLIEKGKTVHEAWRTDFGSSCESILEKQRDLIGSKGSEAILFSSHSAGLNESCRGQIIETMVALGYNKETIDVFVPDAGVSLSLLRSLLLSSLGEAADIASRRISGIPVSKDAEVTAGDTEGNSPHSPNGEPS